MKSVFIDTIPREIGIKLKAPNGNISYVTAHDIFGRWMLETSELVDFANENGCRVSELIVIY